MNAWAWPVPDAGVTETADIGVVLTVAVYVPTCCRPELTPPLVLNAEYTFFAPAKFGLNTTKTVNVTVLPENDCDEIDAKTLHWLFCSTVGAPSVVSGPGVPASSASAIALLPRPNRM